LRNERFLDEPDGGRIPGGAANGTGDDHVYAFESREHWDDRCRLYTDPSRGGPIPSRWPEGYGPPPGDPNCRCPVEVLRKYGWYR
jgi:hypothetical protein